MRVNIYIYKTIKGPGIKKSAYTYILETEKDGKTVTLTDTGLLEPMSEHKAELEIILKALKRLRKECDVNVIGVSIPIKTNFEKYLDKWIKEDWKTAKGKEVANIIMWQQLVEFRNKYQIEMTEDTEHSYRNWMKAESEKRLLNGDSK